jgi:hypothetical protein
MVACGGSETLVVGDGIPDANVDGGGTSSDAATAGQVVAFVLVDVTTGRDDHVLTDGETINLSGSQVTVRTQTEPAVVGSVKFYIDNNLFRIENHSLYTISGNNTTTGTYDRWTLTYPMTLAAGSHIVKATPYSLGSGTGQAGTSLQQTLQIQ